MVNTERNLQKLPARKHEGGLLHKHWVGLLKQVEIMNYPAKDGLGDVYPVEALEFFLGLPCNCFSCFIACKDHLYLQVPLYMLDA